MDDERAAEADASHLVLARQTTQEAVVFFAAWPRITLDGLTPPMLGWLEERRPGELAQRHHFSDALTDLHRLLDEVQFSTCLAHMLLRDFAIRHPDFETVPPPGPPPIPVEALALISGNIPLTRAFLLTEDLHAELPGPRYLSRWLAGQLLDAAFVRAVSALDRLAALVHLAVVEPKLNAHGVWIAPTLSKKDLKEASAHYEGREAWDQLMVLASDEVTQWVREHIRNAFIHRRRRPSALTSEAVALYSYLDENGEYVHDERVGLTAAQHLALIRVTWETVLAPAVDLVQRLFAGDASE